MWGIRYVSKSVWFHFFCLKDNFFLLIINNPFPVHVIIKIKLSWGENDENDCGDGDDDECVIATISLYSNCINVL